MTILEKIHENAKKFPERPAIIENKVAAVETLYWGELDIFSSKLANFIEKNSKTKKPIIVYGHKNPYMIVCFLACVKSGRAYCPIDTNLPIARTEAIIDEVEPEIIFSTEKIDICNDNIIDIASIKRIIDGEEEISYKKYINPDEVFYIIFTSGSTGKPKGVQITRDCLDNFIKWIINVGTGIPSDGYVFVNQAPFSFDLSVMDLYTSLYTGGTLWCLTKELQQNMKEMIDSLSKSNADVWVSTPSFADVCLTDPSFANENIGNIKEFLFCGEVLTNKTVEKLHKRFPNSKVINTYGPTESTCAVTSIDISKEINNSMSPLPVGVPKDGTWLRIIDEDGNEVKDGEHGELVIIGDSVSVGYYNNEEKNKHSFGTTVINEKEYRYYKTGDEVYVLDGLLHYCGRIDLQIKLHGYRIELEDIESNLLKIPYVEQAVVIPRYRDGKVSSIVGGVVYSNNIVDKKETVNEIKKQLKKTLPEYMIPKKIVFIEEIKRTNNGKIDRKSMAEIL